ALARPSMAGVARRRRGAVPGLELGDPFLQRGLPAAVVSTGVRAILVAYLLAYLLLAAMIYRRSNRARMLTLTLSAISVTTHVVLWITGAPTSTLATQEIGRASCRGRVESAMAAE